MKTNNTRCGSCVILPNIKCEVYISFLDEVDTNYPCILLVPK